MSINTGNITIDYDVVLYSDYDDDGDGYLSPTEYDAYIDAGGLDFGTVPRITQEELDAIETNTEEDTRTEKEILDELFDSDWIKLGDTVYPGDGSGTYTQNNDGQWVNTETGAVAGETDAGSGTSVSPYEDGSAADDFYDGFPNPYADLSETEVNAAIIEAADAGEVDVMNAIISATTTAVSAAAQNAATVALYNSIFGDSLSVPEGLLDLTNPDGSSYNYGEGRTYFSIPTIQPGMDWRDQHIDTVDAKKNAEAAVAIYGGTIDQYFTTPNQVSAAQLAITEFDADGDGSLSPQEMEEYVKNYELESGIMYFTDGTEAGGAVAQAADTDGDGVVSVEELAQFNEDRGSDIDPNPARTEFLNDLGFDSSPAAAWMDAYTRQSAESFMTGAQQILTQSLQDGKMAVLNLLQQGFLEQAESGSGTVDYPQEFIDSVNDDPVRTAIYTDVVSYIDRLFGGEQTITRDALLTNDEFYDVGIQLATRNSSTPALSEAGITLTDTDQDLVDRYVAVRDNYQEEISQPETPIGRFIDDVQQDLDELFKDVSDGDVKAKAARDGIQAMLDGAEAFFEQDTVQTAQAVTLKAAGDLMQSAAGAVALMGNNPADTALHQLGTELATLGNETYTQEFQAALTDIDKRIGAAEGFWDTAEAIFGALEEHPTEFLVDKIGSELLQEIPLLLVSGGAATLAKGGAGAIKVGKEIADKWAENAGFVTGVALDLGEAIAANAGGAYEDAIENLLKEGVVNPTTGKAYTQEEAEAKAVEIATNTGLVGGLITAATMGIGGNLFEKAIGKADGIERLGNAIFTQASEAVKKAINKYLGEMGTRIIGVGGATAGETLQEAIDETVTSLTTDVQMEAAGDLDRDYGATTASSLIVGGMTGGTIAGTISTGSAASYWIKTSNAQVAAAVAAAEASVLGGASPKDAAAQLQTELTDLGVDNANIQNDLANSVDDAGYLTQQEVFDTATELNVELLPGQIADYAGQTDELAHMGDLIDGLTKNIYGAPSDAEFDVNNDGVLTGQELVERDQAMEAWEANNPDFETLGTPSLSELDTDGVSGLSNAELTAYANAVGEVVTQRDNNIDDTRARFRALGYEPSNTEVFEYSGKKDQIRGYVDPRQVTLEEAKAELTAQGITNPTDEEAAAYVGQGNGSFQSTQYGQIGTYADPRVVTYDEAKAELIAQGVTDPNDLQIRSYMGQGDETFQETQYGEIKTFGETTVAAAELQEAKENTRNTLLDLGYTPSQTEVDTLVDKTDAELAAYANPRVVTEAEARAELQRLGISNPTEEQLAQYVGSGNETFQNAQFGRIENYADPRVVTEAEARAQLISEGITDPTPEQIAAYVGEGDETFQETQYGSIKTAGEEAAEAARIQEAQATANQLEEDKTAVNNVLTAAGYTSASDTELENLVGKTDAEIEAYANPRVVTEAEARAELLRQGISDPSDALVKSYTGEGGTNFQTSQETEIGDYAAPRVVTYAEAEAELIAQGIENPDKTLVESYMGDGDENFQTNQETKIDEDTVTEAELQGIADEQGYALSTDDVDKYTGVKNQETELATASTDFDSRALDVEEIEAAAAAVGYTLEEGEAETLVRNIAEGTTEAEAITQQENTFDNQSVTLKELQDIAAAQGYELQGDPVEGTGDYAFIGNQDGANNFLTTKEQDFNDLAITEAELEAVALAAGYELNDVDRTLIGNVAEGESAATILEGKQTEFVTSVSTAEAAASRQGYEDTIREHIDNNGGSFSEAEIGVFINQAVTDGTVNGAIGSINTGITTQRNTDTIATAFPNMSAEEVAALLGRVDASNTVDQVIQNQKDIDRVAETFPDLSAEEVQDVLGRVDANNTLTDVITAQQTANTNASNQAALEAAFPDLSPADIDALMGEIAGGKTLEEVIGVDSTGSATGTDAGSETTKTPEETAREQVNAALAASGQTLDEDSITSLVAGIVLGTITDVTQAVTQAVTTGTVDAGTDSTGTGSNVDTDGTPLSDQVDVDETTIDGSPSDLVRVGDFNREVGTLQDNLIKLINQLEANGISRDEALASAIGVPAGQEGGPSGIYLELSNFATEDQVAAIKSIVDNTAILLGNTAADVAAIKAQMGDLVTRSDIEGLATRAELRTELGLAVEGLATQQDVLDAEGRLRVRIGELEAAGNTRLDAIDIAIGELATELGTTQEGVTTALAQFELSINAELANLATKEQVAQTEQDILDKMQEYEDAGLTRDAALQKAIDDVAGALGTTQDVITKQLTEFESSLAVEINTLATKTQVNELETTILTRVKELEDEGIARDDALSQAITEVATDLGTTQDVITKQLTEFESSLTAEIATLATRTQVNELESAILDKLAEYEALGVDRDVALEAAITEVATDLGTTKEAITTQLTEFQTELSAELDTLATKEQVSEFEADLYLEMQRLEDAGMARDEATQLAVSNLATELGLTREQILDQIGTTEQNLTTYVSDVETRLSNQIETEAQTTQDVVTETATETQQQVQEANRRSAFRDFFDLVAGSEDLEGQKVTVGQSPLAQIDYVYDFQSPFATQQQAGFYGSASPYGVPMAAAKQRRPQGLGSIMQGPLNLGGRPPGMAKGGKVDYDFLGEISQIMSFGD